MQPSSRTFDAAVRSARILLIGAEFGTRKLIRTLLLSAGVTDVHDASDGEAGLAAVADLDPDIVILDWQALGMRGADFLRRLRAHDRLPFTSAPIIMLTDHSTPAPVVEAMRLGVHEFLVKPVSGVALRERLASVLMTPRPRRGVTVAPSLQPHDDPAEDAVDDTIADPSADAIVAE